MSQGAYLRAQACNSALSIHRLLSACARLGPEALRDVRTNFFPTIIGTLNHILTVDLFYITALEGDCIGLSVFTPAMPFPDINQLWDEQARLDRRLIAVCTDVPDDVADRPVRIVRGAKVQEEPFARVAQHLFQHQIHHRGQVHAMLAGTNVAPPQLDEFFLSTGPDVAGRVDELVALGLSEETIWP